MGKRTHPKRKKGEERREKKREKRERREKEREKRKRERESEREQRREVCVCDRQTIQSFFIRYYHRSQAETLLLRHAGDA